MPASKKPNRKPASGKTSQRAPRKTTQEKIAVPIQQHAIEQLLAAIGGSSVDAPFDQAQQIMYDAWEQTSAKARIALARKALAISPLCADAYVLLAACWRAKTIRA